MPSRERFTHSRCSRIVQPPHQNHPPLFVSLGSIAAPPLSNVAAWRDIITRRAIHEFRPEEFVAVYDTRSPSSDPKVVREIEKYILLLIERLLEENLGYGDLRNSVAESKHLARNSIHDALLDPESEDGQSLRTYFRRTIQNRCVDAFRKQLQYDRRYTALKDLGENFEVDLDGSPKGHHRGSPDRNEDRLIWIIDLENMTEAEAHAGRRLTLEMTIRGYAQDEIALATGASVRQVRRWQKSFVT